MLRLLDDIIAIATIEVGQMARDPDDLAAEDLWQPQSTQWLDLAEQRGVAIDLPDGRAAPAGRLTGDGHRLRQALDSVFCAAIDGTPQGGRVRLSTYLPENPGPDIMGRLCLRIESHSGGLDRKSTRLNSSH